MNESIKHLYFRLQRTYADSWGFYNRPEEVDLDLARDIVDLFGQSDPRAEELIASALAKHRRSRLTEGGRYVMDDES